jgi:hypothetical protein
MVEVRDRRSRILGIGHDSDGEYDFTKMTKENEHGYTSTQSYGAGASPCADTG